MTINLSTQLGRLTLNSPLIVGACPLSAKEMLQISMVSSGAGAIVLPSLFAEHFDLENYLELLQRTSRQCAIPIIASLNGSLSDHSVWSSAGSFQSAGASAVELHFRWIDPSHKTVSQNIEDELARLIENVKATTELPLFLKLDRGHVDTVHLAQRLNNTIDGMVLFGREPIIDFELGNLHLKTEWGLTQPGSIRESLKSILQVRAGCPNLTLVGNGGIASSQDLIKSLLAGANAGMVVSALYRNNVTMIGTMLEGLRHFMDQHQFHSLDELRARGTELFSHFDQQQDYIRTLSSDPDLNHAPHDLAAIASDRWGHPQSSSVKTN